MRISVIQYYCLFCFAAERSCVGPSDVCLPRADLRDSGRGRQLQAGHAAQRPRRARRHHAVRRRQGGRAHLRRLRPRPFRAHGQSQLMKLKHPFVEYETTKKTRSKCITRLLVALLP